MLLLVIQHLIIYSGYIYDSQVKHLKEVADSLKIVGGELEIISEENNKKIKLLLESSDNIKFRNYFDKNRTCSVQIAVNGSLL